LFILKLTSIKIYKEKKRKREKEKKRKKKLNGFLSKKNPYERAIIFFFL